MENSIHILITGDFYGGAACESLIQSGQFDKIFNDFLSISQQADIVITNLEAPLLTDGTPVCKTGPAIKAIPEIADALQYAGFSLVTLANNHIMDFGKEGLTNTLEILKNKQISYVGAGMNFDEASKTFYATTKDKTFAFINVAENEWSTTFGDYPGANPLNPTSNYYAIKEAKSKAAFVIVIVHGGLEMYPLPTPRMKETFRFFIDAGADVVLAHHTHCISGYEIYNSKPIFYGLGNFLFENPKEESPDWFTGLAVLLQINHASALSFDIIPLEQNKEGAGIRVLHGETKQQIINQINQLNKIIGNDKELAANFEKYVKDHVSKTYRNYLEPFSLKTVRLLMRLGIIKSLLSKKKKRYYLNLIRCETHREVVIKLLNDDCNTQQ